MLLGSRGLGFRVASGLGGVLRRLRGFRVPGLSVGALGFQGSGSLDRLYVAKYPPQIPSHDPALETQTARAGDDQNSRDGNGGRKTRKAVDEQVVHQ